MSRHDALLVEVDVSDEDVRRGHLFQVAWLYQRRLQFWHDGGAYPGQLRTDLAQCGIVVAYDVNRVVGPHIHHRLGISVGFPRADVRSMTAMLPVELAARFPLPPSMGLHGIVKRLATVRMAWNWIRAHR